MLLFRGASFFKSVASLEDVPASVGEIAFAGRSNSGESIHRGSARLWLREGSRCDSSTLGETAGRLSSDARAAARLGPHNGRAAPDDRARSADARVVSPYRKAGTRAAYQSG